MGAYVAIFAALLNHHRRHPWQGICLMVGLISGTALWVALQQVNGQARQSYAQADRLLGAVASHWVRGERGVSGEDYMALRRAGLRGLYPVIESRLVSATGVPFAIIATDLLALPREDSDSAARGAGPSWPDLLAPPSQTWMSRDLARALDAIAGQPLTLSGGAQLPTVALASMPQQGRRALLDIGAAMALLGRDDFDYLGVSTGDPEVLAQLELALPTGLRVEANNQRLDLETLTRSLHIHLDALGLLAFVVGLFIVINAVRFSLLARGQVLATLRILGTTRVEIALVVASETLIWALLATLLGVAVGSLLAQALVPAVAASLDGLYGATLATGDWINLGVLTQAFALNLLGLAAALAWPLLALLRQSPLHTSGRQQNLQADHRIRRRTSWLGLGLAVFAMAIVYPRADDIATAFVLLGLVLLAAAWMLPGLLATLLVLAGTLSQRADVVTRWRLQDGWAQLPSLRIAMMALLLALTANNGINTMVGSFRAALDAWLAQRLSADLYIQSASLDVTALQAQAGDWLLYAHARNGLDLRWQDQPVLVRGLDTKAPDSQSLPLAASDENLWEQWSRGESGFVLVNEQAHHLGKIALGSAIQLPRLDGSSVEFTVAAVFRDYGNPRFQFYLPRQVVAHHWPSATPQGVGLWLDGEDPDHAQTMAESGLLAAGALPGEWLSQRDLRRISQALFERTFAITATMNGLTLGVAGIALLVATGSLLQRRRDEFALWQALGAGRAHILAVALLPTLLFVVAVWLLSLPLGTLLSWLLIHRVNLLAFGWTMSLRSEPGGALWLALACLAVWLACALLSYAYLRRTLQPALARLGSPSA